MAVETIKTRYKYIEFAESEPTLWVCTNRAHGDSLGCVEWYRQWRRWVFTPNHNTVFSVDCLQDIIHFVGQLPGHGPVSKPRQCG